MFLGACDIVYQYCWCVHCLVINVTIIDNFLSMKKTGYITNEIGNIPWYIGYMSVFLKLSDNITNRDTYYYVQYGVAYIV